MKLLKWSARLINYETPVILMFMGLNKVKCDIKEIVFNDMATPSKKKELLLRNFWIVTICYNGNWLILRNDAVSVLFCLHTLLFKMCRNLPRIWTVVYVDLQIQSTTIICSSVSIISIMFKCIFFISMC